MVSATDIREVLHPDDRDDWDEYWRLETDGPRRDSALALERIVPRLEGYPAPERERFVAALMSFVRGDADRRHYLRPPLFARIVLPVLLGAFDRGEVGSARTLREVRDLIRTDTGNRDLSSATLLERAMEQEPAARDLQEAWLAQMKDDLDWATHEAPALVLYGNRAATEDECAELLGFVDRFETHARKLGVLSRHAASIEEWRNYLAD